MPALTPGSRLHDRYLLERRIGAGGMAQVWLAYDTVLGRQVAIKTLAGQAAAEPALRAGAKREAQAAAKLTHPHITAVHDYAEQVWPDGTVTPYLVMELLRGETLADRLVRGPLPWPQAAVIGGQIASALAAAHAQGVVHQDVKPANIMLTDSDVKVLDFGIAAVTGTRDDSGWIIGTPAYAPPERLRQAPPDPSADTYGLGAVLFEMVTGHRPWPIETWEQAQRHHAQRFSPPPLPMEVPAQAAALIREALDPLPQRRPTASAFAQMLGGGPAKTLMAPVGGVIAGSASVRPRQHTEVVYQEPPRKGRSPAMIAVAAVAVLIVLIGGVFLLTGLLRGDGNTATASPSGPVVNPVTSTAPSPTPVIEIPELLVALGQAIDAGEAADQIEPDKARDLRQDIRDIAKQRKTKDLVNKVENMRERIEGWDSDEIDEELADSLIAILSQIEKQASQRTRE